MDWMRTAASSLLYVLLAVMATTAMGEERARSIPTRSPSDIKFSPDGRTLAVCSMEAGTVELWDVPSKQRLRALGVQRMKPLRLAFAPNGQWLAAAIASSDKAGEPERILAWETQRWTPRILEDREADCTSRDLDIAFLADSSTLVSCGNGRLKTWNVTTGETLWRMPSVGNRLLASFDEWSKVTVPESLLNALRNLIVDPLERKVAEYWYGSSGPHSPPRGHKVTLAFQEPQVKRTRMALSPDRKLVAIGYLAGRASPQKSEARDARSQDNTQPSAAVAEPPSLPSGLDDYLSFEIWDVESRSQLSRLPVHAPDLGQRITLKGPAEQPKTEVVEGRGNDQGNRKDVLIPLPEFRQESRTIDSISFGQSPQDKSRWLLALAASASAPNAQEKASVLPVVYRLNEMERRGRCWSRYEFEYIPDEGFAISVVSVAPNGVHVACGDEKGRLRIWEMAAIGADCDRRPLKELACGRGRIAGIAFSADGKMLASISHGEDVVRVWNIEGIGEAK